MLGYPMYSGRGVREAREGTADEPLPLHEAEAGAQEVHERARRDGIPGGDDVMAELVRLLQGRDPF